MAGISIEGKNKWMTLIVNAALMREMRRGPRVLPVFG